MKFSYLSILFMLVSVTRLHAGTCDNARTLLANNKASIKKTITLLEGKNVVYDYVAVRQNLNELKGAIRDKSEINCRRLKLSLLVKIKELVALKKNLQEEELKKNLTNSIVQQ